jgi:hypothetical protein
MLGMAGGPARANDHGGNGGDPRIVPTSAVIEGRTYHEWTAAWWQWVTAFAPDANPATDTTGEFAGQGQSGAVYFLAGTFGGSAVRAISVPFGRYFWLPMATSEWDTVPGIPNPLELPDPLSIPDIRRIAASMSNDTVVTCTIDGVRVNNPRQYRVRSPVFSMNMDPDFAEFGGYPTSYIRTAVADGYWLMVKPLPVGRHTIRFTGRNARFGFALDVTYNITITPNGPLAR